MSPASRPVAERYRVRGAEEADLRGALEALAGPLRRRGVEVVVGVAVGRLLCHARVVQIGLVAKELLLGVGEHDPYLVTVLLMERGGRLRLTVGHDRIAARARVRTPPRARRRLALVADSLAASGGSLVIDSRPGFAAYTASLPVAE